eukprot:933593_1
MGAVVGMGIGDAVGAPLEFLESKNIEFTKNGNYDLRANHYGKEKNKFEVLPGQWTDDSAMGFCLADSLLVHGKLDGADMRARQWNWWMHGYNNAFRYDHDRPTRTKFGQTSIGLGGNIGTSFKMLNYKDNEVPAIVDKPTSDDAGNACLSRLAAVPVFFAGSSFNEVTEMARQSCHTTHPG